MKVKEYERPELEELELFLEGSFLKTGTGDNSGSVGGEIDPDNPIGPGEGDDIG